MILCSLKHNSCFKHTKFNRQNTNFKLHSNNHIAKMVNKQNKNKKQYIAMYKSTVNYKTRWMTKLNK